MISKTILVFIFFLIFVFHGATREIIKDPSWTRVSEILENDYIQTLEMQFSKTEEETKTIEKNPTPKKKRSVCRCDAALDLEGKRGDNGLDGSGCGTCADRVVLLWDEIENRSFCSGVLYNERFVITAAHCISDSFGTLGYPLEIVENPDNVMIEVGNTHLAHITGHDFVNVVRIYLPWAGTSNHRTSTFSDTDIALLELEPSLPEMAKLELGPKPLPGSLLYQYGWGIKNGGDKPKSVGFQRQMTVLDSACRSLLGPIPADILCFQEPPFKPLNSWGPGTTTGGDSGSPIYDQDGRLVAIHSWGTPSAYLPNGGVGLYDQRNRNFILSEGGCGLPFQGARDALSFWFIDWSRTSSEKINSCWSL